MKTNISREEAIEIIHNERIKNSFTMGLTLEEFVKGLRIRYLKMYGVQLGKDYISIANKIIEINNNKEGGVWL